MKKKFNRENINDFKRRYHTLAHKYGMDFKSSLEYKRPWVQKLVEHLGRKGMLRIRVWIVKKPVGESNWSSVYYTRPKQR